MPTNDRTPSVHELRAAVVALVRHTHPAATRCRLMIPVTLPDGYTDEDTMTISISNPEPDIEAAIVTALSVFRHDVWVKSRSVHSELKAFGDWTEEYVKEVLARMAGAEKPVIESKAGPNGGYRVKNAKDT